MPVVDFRTLAFDTDRVAASGRHVGRRVFPKLYAIENILRSIIHSILSAQSGANWWDTMVAQNIKDKVEKFRDKYARRPRHSSPGRHGIYYLDLFDLNEIIRSNVALFRAPIPDIDNWMVNIEQLRLPRNVVAHMNWLHKTDRGRIDVFHEDLLSLVVHLQTAGTAISSPA
jgi:hypothetical protein